MTKCSFPLWSLSAFCFLPLCKNITALYLSAWLLNFLIWFLFLGSITMLNLLSKNSLSLRAVTTKQYKFFISNCQLEMILKFIIMSSKLFVSM